MNDKEHFRSAYADGRVLTSKENIHARYSSKPIDLHGIVVASCCASTDLSVLDIGCGTGQFLEYLSSRGHRGSLVGIDLAPPDIPDTAGKRYVAGDAEALPFEDESFETVTCLHTLSHIRDLDAAMAEARRVLRPGGIYAATANSLTSYPTVDRYRRRVHQLLGRGEATFTTTYLNAENLAPTLSRYWHTTELHTYDGELRIPTTEFVEYFAANIPTWDREPTASQREEILHWVLGWALLDQQDDHIIEPKRVALVLCTAQ